VLYGRVEGRRAARKGEPGRRSANTSGSGTKLCDMDASVIASSTTRNEEARRAEWNGGQQQAQRA
jgi:hypothetical protein